MLPITVFFLIFQIEIKTLFTLSNDTSFKEFGWITTISVYTGEMTEKWDLRYFCSSTMTWKSLYDSSYIGRPTIRMRPRASETFCFPNGVANKLLFLNSTLRCKMVHWVRKFKRNSLSGVEANGEECRPVPPPSLLGEVLMAVAFLTFFSLV